MDGPRWFRVDAAETLSDENFTGWSLEERGAWFTLICFAWREGSIPADLEKMARILHCDGSRMALLWPAIADRFQPHPDLPGRLVSARQERERDEAKRLSELKAAAGREGASARWGKGKRDRKRTDSNRIAVPSAANAVALAKDATNTLRKIPPKPPQGGSAEEPSCPVWAEVLQAVASKLRDDIVAKWFKPLVGARRGDALVLEAPDEFHRRFVEDNYRRWLDQDLLPALGHPLQVRIVVAAPKRAAGGTS